MVTSEIVEALELFERLFHDDAQRRAVLAVKEMLCDWSEEEWLRMSEAERKAWLSQFTQKQPENSAYYRG